MMRRRRRAILAASLAMAVAAQLGCSEQPTPEEEAALRHDLLVGTWAIVPQGSAPSGAAQIGGHGISFRPDGTGMLLGSTSGELSWEMHADTVFLTDPNALPGEPRTTGLQIDELTDTSLVFTMGSASTRLTRALLGELDGTISYSSRRELPAGAVLHVVLEDVSRADAPAVELGRQSLTDPGPSPVAFRIPYIATAIEPENRYAVRAQIDNGGRTLHRTTQAFPVITDGQSENVAITLEAAR